MVELTNMRKLRWTQKKKQVQEAVTQKAKQASDWVKQNQETLAVAIPAGVVALKGGLKTVRSFNHNHAVKRDIRDRQTRFYDHGLGMYWHTKRPLTQDELLSVKRRRAAGENYGDIFSSMKLLK